LPWVFICAAIHAESNRLHSAAGFRLIGMARLRLAGVMPNGSMTATTGE